MTTPPSAWPELDEDLLRRRAEALLRTQENLNLTLETWRVKKTAIFNQQSWFGAASSAAEKKVNAHINSMEDLDRRLTRAIDFYDDSYDKVVAGKDAIADVCDAVQSAIDKLAEESDDDGKDRSSDIQALVDRALSINTQIVSAVAVSVGSATEPKLGDARDQVANIVQDLGFGKDTQNEASPAPIGANLPKVPPAAPAGLGGDASNDASTGGPDGGTPVVQQAGYSGDSRPADNAPQASVEQNFNDYFPQAGNQDGSATGGDWSPAPMTSGSSGGGGSSGGLGGGGVGSQLGKNDIANANGRNNVGDKVESQSGKFKPESDAENRPLTPFEQQQKLVNDVAKGMTTGGQQALQQISTVPPAGTGQVPLTGPTPEAPVATPPAAAAGPSAPSSGGGGFGGSGGGGGGGMAPIGGGSAGAAPPPMPLAPPATPPPAGPVGGGAGAGGSSAGSNAANAGGNAPTGPGVHAASTTSASQAAAAAPAPIPVSAARMERDAIASASAAGAIRRQKRGGGNDGLTLARRIAAALNVGVMDFGFYWVTGLCVDGTIVVANSYGLAYIPEGVNLPPNVQMATADESIPAVERAKWSTYPMLAVQGWVHAHGQQLRAVVATDAQFSNFDPGVAKVVLQPDDIPDTGKMDGRSRLEVIAPEAAARLAAVGDSALIELLPPAFADTEAPTDQSSALWFDLCKPLMSRMADRWILHLESFLIYAEHAQDLALHRALTATDATVQRTAIANWVYWQHSSVLVSDALSADITV